MAKRKRGFYFHPECLVAVLIDRSTGEFPAEDYVPSMCGRCRTRYRDAVQDFDALLDKLITEQWFVSGDPRMGEH